MNLKFWTWGKTPTQGTSTSIWATGTKAVYPELNNGNLVQKSFNNNAAVYSIVKKDAKKFGSIRKYVMKNDTEITQGDLYELLKRPNKTQGQDAFFTLLRAFYKVCGEAYIWLNRGDTSTITGEELDDDAHARKPILEMYVLPSQDVVVVPEDDNPYGISGYSLQSRPDIKFRAVDIIQWKDINLNWDSYTRTQLRGMSPLQPGKKILTANDAATDNTVAMNQNGGAKKALANKNMAQMNPQQQSQLNNVMDMKVNNLAEKGAVAAFQGDWSVLDLGMSSIDMDVLNGKAYSMQELCFLLGMPYELFDAKTTYANKEMAQKGWVINEIVPDTKQLDDELSRVLPLAFGDKNVDICSDFDDLAELQIDKKTQVEWLSKAPLTADEQREALGYEPTGEEGADKIIIGSQSLESIAGGDGGDQILQNLYNADGRTNSGNGDE